MIITFLVPIVGKVRLPRIKIHLFEERGTLSFEISLNANRNENLERAARNSILRLKWFLALARGYLSTCFLYDRRSLKKVYGRWMEAMHHHLVNDACKN